jgi:predicted permease
MRLWWRGRNRKENELDAELRFHLEEEAEERRAGGLPPDQARSAAWRDLGNVALVREDTRAAWTWTWWEQLVQDLRYGLRTMAANRTFTALAVLSLALGIGANTAIFSFLDALLLRTLPASEPHSLVMLQWHTGTLGRDSVFRSGWGRVEGGKGDHTGAIFPLPAFDFFEQQSDLFSSVFGRFAPGALHMVIAGQGESAHVEFVTGEYFRGLGVSAAAGRAILPEDDRAGAPPVAMLGYGLAARRFGSPAAAVGQTIEINAVPFLVAGVTPRGFSGVEMGNPADLYIPLHTTLLLPDPQPPAAWFHDANAYWFHILARLRPGVTAAQARASLAGPYHRWVDATATTDRQRADLPVLLIKDGSRGLDSQRYDYAKPLWILTGLVALILAMTCANIANLLLARSGGRAREMAIRLSIGAGRRRVLRQLLTESVVLAGVGGAFGLVFAVWGVRFLNLLLANHTHGTDLEAQINWHVLAVAAGLSLATGILFGLAPALRATRVNLMPALKELQGSQARSRLSLARVLTVAQVAIALVMLVAAGLFARTLANLHSVALGFHPENILTFNLNAREAGHRGPELAVFYAGLQQRFAALPGVRGASLTGVPLIGSNWFMPAALRGEEPKTTNFMAVGADFFSTVELPILRGRGIEARDRAGAPRVAVVNERFVQERCGGRDPIGQTFRLEDAPDGPAEMTIVGVAANARYRSLKDELTPVVYPSFSQRVLPLFGMTYVLRTAGNPLALAGAVREVVRRADPRLPVTELMTESAQIDRTVNQEIAFARLCSAFALLALAIACVGLYGTLSYNVTRRTGEIGIRMALGAQRSAVVRMVLREVAAVGAAGFAISVPAALAASRLVRSFLFGLEPNDPAAMITAVAILAAAAMLAGYVPARRASRIDPLHALRHE